MQIGQSSVNLSCTLRLTINYCREGVSVILSCIALLQDCHALLCVAVYCESVVILSKILLCCQHHFPGPVSKIYYGSIYGVLQRYKYTT